MRHCDDCGSNKSILLVGMVPFRPVISGSNNIEPGKLHPLIFYDTNKPAELSRTKQFGDRILELCVAVGGGGELDLHNPC